MSQWSAAHERVLQAERVAYEEYACRDADELQREVVRILLKMQPVESRWVRIHDVFWLRVWLEPAAVAGGPAQVEDVADFVYRVRSNVSLTISPLLRPV